MILRGNFNFLQSYEDAPVEHYRTPARGTIALKQTQWQTFVFSALGLHCWILPSYIR